MTIILGKEKDEMALQAAVRRLREGNEQLAASVEAYFNERAKSIESLRKVDARRRHP